MAKKTNSPTELPKGLWMKVPVVHIRTTGTNPRKHFNDQDIEELASSIKAIGLLQPVICMKGDDDFIFTLICGERRFKAAQKAGLIEIPAIVYDPLPANTVFEMQITENLQRKDINPMEESMAFSELVKRGIKTAEQIADKLGVSTKYVYDRLALQRVIPEVQEKIESGDLSISHGKHFARISKDDQEKLWASVSTNPHVTLGIIKDLISRTFTKKLSEAVFSTTDPLLYKKAGACTTCPKRSGCNQLLFDDIHQEDICFDQNCFDQKVQNHLDDLYDLLVKEGKKVVKISNAWRAKGEGLLSRNDWDEVSKGKPYDAIGIVFEENEYDKSIPLGKVMEITIDIEKEEDEDEENDDLEDGGTTSAGSVKDLVKKERIDWQDVFMKRIDQQVVNFFICNPTKKIRSVLIEEFADAFHQISDDTALLIAEKFGWEVVKREDNKWNPYDLRKTALNAVENADYSNAILMDLTHFFNVLSCYDESFTYDFEDFQKASARLFEMGIDLRGEIKAINLEAGNDEIEIPEPDPQEEPEEVDQDEN